MDLQQKPVSIPLVVGGLLTFIGAVFSVLSVWMFNNMDYIISHGRGDVEAMPFIFGGIGGVLLISGVGLLVSIFLSKQKTKRLLADGNYIIAEITGVVPDFTVRVRNFPTYRVTCVYRDKNTGVQYNFKSKNLLYDPTGQFTWEKVRVYVRKDDVEYRDYYVDIDSVLPQKS